MSTLPDAFSSWPRAAWPDLPMTPAATPSPRTGAAASPYPVASAASTAAPTPYVALFPVDADGRVDAAYMHDWLAASSPQLAALMDGHAHARAVSDVEKSLLWLFGLTRMFVRARDEEIPASLRVFSQHLDCIRRQLRLYGEPGTHMTILDMRRPIPAADAVTITPTPRSLQ